MSRQKKENNVGRIKSSIVLRLNSRLFLRLLGIYVFMDLLLSVLAFGGLMVWSENQCADIAALVEERGVRPGEITAVTFTNQAAAEMRLRLEARLGGKRAVSPMTIGTFHAICLKLLGDVRLISPGEALTIAEQVLRESGRKGGGKALLQAVSRVKNGASPEDAGLDAELYGAYQARLRDLGALDFDDLLTEGLKRDVTGLRRFRHVLVDEFQDLNDIQYQLLWSWSRSGELFVIGDPDQSIYGFRGADCRCFQRLQEERSDVKEIHLTENYRSAPAILDTALAVIGHNPGGSRTLTPHCPSGPAVRRSCRNRAAK